MKVFVSAPSLRFSKPLLVKDLIGEMPEQI